MKKIKVKLNRAGVREVLLSSSEPCMEYASQVANRAGEGWETKEYKGKNRAGATVYTDDEKTFYRNLHNNTLEKALK